MASLTSHVTQDILQSRLNNQSPLILERFEGAAEKSVVSIDDALFQPFPPEIVFKGKFHFQENNSYNLGYKPYETYEINLTMRNSDKVARAVSMETPNSTIFSVIAKNNEKKIAAGMETTFTVRFVPDSDKDFQYDLVCITEREKFIVPVRTIGSRGLLPW